MRLEPVERRGRRDLSGIGLGLVALGLFGFVGAVMSLFSGHGGLGEMPYFVFGALLLVLAGFVMIGAARGGGLGVASGLATGCASVVALLAIGALLVLATIGYMILSCLNKLGH